MLRVDCCPMLEFTLGRRFKGGGGTNADFSSSCLLSPWQGGGADIGFPLHAVVGRGFPLQFVVGRGFPSQSVTGSGFPLQSVTGRGFPLQSVVLDFVLHEKNSPHNSTTISIEVSAMRQMVTNTPGSTLHRVIANRVYTNVEVMRRSPTIGMDTRNVKS